MLTLYRWNKAIKDFEHSKYANHTYLVYNKVLDNFHVFSILDYARNNDDILVATKYSHNTVVNQMFPKIEYPLDTLLPHCRNIFHTLYKNRAERGGRDFRVSDIIIRAIPSLIELNMFKPEITSIISEIMILIYNVEFKGTKDE